MKISFKNRKSIAKFSIVSILIIFSIIFLLHFVFKASASPSPTDISICSELNVAGETYLLTVDIINSSVAVCMNITANNTILDCQGHTIGSNKTFGFEHGVFVEGRNNVTVRNCVLREWNSNNIVLDNTENSQLINITSISCNNYGIYFVNSHNNRIINSTSNSSAYGIRYYDSENNSIENAKVASNSLFGMYMEYEGCTGNNFTNLSFSENQYGLGIISGTDNIIKDSTFTNGTGECLYLSDNIETPNWFYNNLFNCSGYVEWGGIYTNKWNITQQTGTRIYSSGTEIGGNYWTNSTGNGFSDTCTDSDTDGFCDSSYIIDPGQTGNNTDHLPLSNEYSETGICDYTISDCSVLNQAGSTYCLDTDIINTSTDPCMNITANNIVLDCQGHIIDSTKTLGIDNGIIVDRSPAETTNITIKNCTISDWYNSNIVFGGSHGNTITNITSVNCINYNIYFVDSHNNTISNSFINKSIYGIYFYEGTGNKVVNTTISYQAEFGVYFWAGNNSNVTNSTITNCGTGTTGAGIYLQIANSISIFDNIIQNNTNGFDMSESGETSPNYIYNNLINNTLNVKYVPTYTNYYNTTKQTGAREHSLGTYIGGNYWTNSTGNGFSDTCIDSNKDGFCDSAYNVTSDSSCTSGVDCGNNVDYLAYSDEYSTSGMSYSQNSTNNTIASQPTLFSLKWTDDIGLNFYRFSFDNCTGTFANDSWSNSGWEANPTEAWSNTSKVINSTIGCTVKWKYYANDTDGNEVVSSEYSFSTTDNTPPTWSNNQSSIPSNYSLDTPSKFNITCTDNVDISKVLIEIRNSTVTLVNNITMSNATYGGSIYNYSLILPAGTWNWTAYCNDTYNNWNKTDIWSFTIGKGAVNIDIYFRNSTGEYLNQNMSINEGQQLNVTAVINISSQNSFVLYQDGVSKGSQSGNKIEYLTSSLTLGTYYFNSTYLATQNYSTFTRDPYVKINDITIPTYSLNSTNSTVNGTAVKHSLRWADGNGLSYAIFSFDNCTGSLQNITNMSLSGTPAWSNFTATINSTVGCTIRWCVYANDTSNNWNGTSCSNPFTYVTTTPDTTSPTISNVQSSSITSSSATITWTTNENANSSLVIAPSATYSNSSSMVTSHSISLSGMTAETTYYYNVTSCDASENCNTSTGHQFTTIAETGGGGYTPPTVPSNITNQTNITVCGNNLCETGENILNCWVDCNPFKLLNLSATDQTNITDQTNATNISLTIINYPTRLAEITGYLLSNKPMMALIVLAKSMGDYFYRWGSYHIIEAILFRHITFVIISSIFIGLLIRRWKLTKNSSGFVKVLVYLIGIPLATVFVSTILPSL